MNSSVLKWPSADAIDRAVRSWTAEQIQQRPDIVAIGYFGSYARGDWGVGSDLDLIAVVKETSEPFERRPVEWDLSRLPVPAEILVYSLPEWQNLCSQGGRFARVLNQEVIWTYNTL